VTRYRNAALFLVLAVLWGTAFVAIRTGLEHIPPVLFAALRYDVAGVIVLAYAAWAVEDWIPRGRQWLLVVAGGTLMIAAYHAFLFVGEQTTKSAPAAVIVALSPVLTAGFARTMLPGERLSGPGVAGLVFGLVGVGLLASPDPGNLLAGDVVGKVLVFLAAASFALGSVLTRWIDAELPIETMEAWSMLLGAGLMHVVSLWPLGESPADVAWNLESIGALAFLSLGASAVGFLLYFDLLERLGPTEINLVSYVAPVFAAVAGYFLRGEVIGVPTVVGFAVIFVGFVLIKRGALREELDWIRARRSGDPDAK
jgi:drug/metabolite transporter (DMT)-like permease